jgi:hypothetical protein
MVMLSEELLGKEYDPTPELDMVSMCAMVEKEDSPMPRQLVAAEKQGELVSRQRNKENWCRGRARVENTATIL